MTGRQLARVSAVKYHETIWSELYPGNQHTLNCFQPAVLAAENALELAERQRCRTVWRLDGGAGSDDQFRWLLSRDYQVIGKGLWLVKPDVGMLMTITSWPKSHPPLIMDVPFGFLSNAASKTANGVIAIISAPSTCLLKGIL